MPTTAPVHGLEDHVRFHTASDYALLEDIDARDVGTLDENDRRCLNDIGTYLVQSRQHERLGISLLHRHFDIFDHEVLMQTVVNRNTIYLKPVLTTELVKESLFPINIRFVETVARDHVGRDGMQLVGLEYAAKEGRDNCTRLGDSDVTTLQEIRRILEKHGKLNRFSVRSAQASFDDVGQEYVFAETCDQLNRLLTLKPVRRDDASIQKNIETFWMWEPTGADDDGDQVVNAVCAANCHVVCSPRGPVGHGTDHREDHKRIPT